MHKKHKLNSYFLHIYRLKIEKLFQFIILFMSAIIAISLKKAITAGSVKNAAVIFLNLTLKDIIPAADIINKKTAKYLKKRSTMRL